MLTQEEIGLIKASIPLLQEHGEAVTKHFYQSLFEKHPSLKVLFNQSNQARGLQQNSLAQAVLAYASHIEQPEVLKNRVLEIAHKHTALGVVPEQYQVVGETLLASIKAVAGPLAPDSVIAAWGKAYGILADLFIETETALYGVKGWKGTELFTINKIVSEHPEIKSFYVKPMDFKCPSGELPHFKPGQYITVGIPEVEGDLSSIQQWRHYSLSTGYDARFYRISSRMERQDPAHPGYVSHQLHQCVEGQQIAIRAPAGAFFLKTHQTHPVNLFAAGIGITPILSMFSSIAHNNPLRPVNLAFQCQGPSRVYFFQELLACLKEIKNANLSLCFSTPVTQENGAELLAMIRQEQLEDKVTLSNQDLYPEAWLQIGQTTEYYLCGPQGWMQQTHSNLVRQGVQESHIFAELFHPQ